MFDVELNRKYITTAFINGYYNYSFVITFKPDSNFARLHPAKAHRLFEASFNKYLKRHTTIKYIIFGELSQQGSYHLHGLLFDKESDYDKHESRLRLIKNFLNRNYGWQGFQRIYSLTDPYKTTDQRFRNKQYTTTFEQIWDYITKDIKMFPFLYPVKNLN